MEILSARKVQTQKMMQVVDEKAKINSISQPTIEYAFASNPDLKDYTNDKKVETATKRKIELERQLAKHDVDVFFLCDNTGSMGGLISSVQAQAKEILNGLQDDSRFSDVTINYGVGIYKGDPTEYGETPLTAYKLLQSITSDKDAVIDAINKWEASGGGDWEEANFYAIQQVATEGDGVPRDGSKATEQKTGWRSDAAKVIVVFGDAPSWQNSVNEKAPA